MHFQLPQLVFIVDRFAVEYARGMHPLSRSPMRGEWAWLRSMLAVEGTGGPDGAVKGYAAHCLRMRCLARDIRRTIADDFDPEVLGQVKHGHRGGAPEGSDIVTICGLPTFMRAISTRRRRRALSDKFTCLRRGAVAPRAAEAMLAPCPLRSFHGSFLFDGGVGGIHFPQVLIRGTRVAVCLVTSCRRSFFRYSCRLMNRSVSSYER